MESALESNEDSLKSVGEVIDHLDAIADVHPGWELAEAQPVFWPLEQTGNIPNRGTFVAGRLASKYSLRGQQMRTIYPKPKGVRKCFFFIFAFSMSIHCRWSNPGYEFKSGAVL